MEEAFGQQAYASQFDSFMRHYLTCRTRDIPRQGDVYSVYKRFATDMAGLGATNRKPAPSALPASVPASVSAGDEATTTGSGAEPNAASSATGAVNPAAPGGALIGDGSLAAMVKDLSDYARFYAAMALGKEKDSKLAAAFKDLRELRVDVAYPFLLELYADYARGVLTSDDLLTIVRLIEAYVFRRAVCSMPTNSLNKTFATFGRELKKDRYVESVKAHFLRLPDYKRFPSDAIFAAQLKTRDLYTFRNRSYWLRKFENHERNERVHVEDYTIEHILPQNEDLKQEWRDALGPDWAELHKIWVNTAGNLTLTGYNSEMSDKSFAEKRDMENGFKQSPLRLNKGLGQLQTWGVQQIEARAERLAEFAITIWQAPSLSQDVLDGYAKAKPVTGGFAIEDHKYLLGAETRALFEEVRKRILALEDGVTEEFTKVYVAYKFDGNFVDIIGQAKGLLAIINRDPGDLDDPKEMVRDITAISGWGNGNSEVRITQASQIDDLMKLVRQSLEAQIASDEQAA